MTTAQQLNQIKASLPPAVTLVAVSKTRPVEMILEAYEAGQRDFGENYVQEMADKYNQLPKDIRWHFIGHLQSNKVKSIAPFVHLVHGVDSIKLLHEINKQALKNNRIIDCLFQIYIAVEETKFGLSFDECGAILRSGELNILKNVRIKGFMAMASNTASHDQVLKEFMSLKEFHAGLVKEGFNFPILSFGMSGDYKLALACGSNMVRIGSAIFGEREYTKV